MMKRTLRWCQTPPSVTVSTKHHHAYSLEIKRGCCLKRPSGPGAQVPEGKRQQSQCQQELHPAKAQSGAIVVVHRDEMAAFFRIFGEWLFSYKEPACYF